VVKPKKGDRVAEEKKETPSEFELMDREDEEQILDELRGVPVDKFIYKNARGQYELSYAGTKWAVREMANRGEAIRIEGHPKTERCQIDPAEHITVTILAKRVKVDREAHVETVLDTTVGSSRGWIKQKLVDGRVVPDEHFFTKTVSKATRNGQQALMPQDFKKEIIETLQKMQASGGKLPAKAPAKPPAQQGAPAAQQPQKPAAPQGTATQSGTAPAASPAQQAKPGKPKPANTADAFAQRLNVVLKQALKTQDEKLTLQALRTLTGFGSTTEVPVETVKQLGPILNQVAKGQAKVVENRILNVSGNVLWGPPLEEPPPQEAPPEEVEQEQPMF
jgi:hypothetical protein